MWFVLKIPAVQNYIAQKAADRISKDWNTKVKIKNVNFELFNSLNLEGLLIEDLKKDTLLYAGSAQVKITDWFFLKTDNDLSYLALKDFNVNINRLVDSVWNFQFIVDKYSSSDTTKKNTTITSAPSKANWSFKNIVLENGRINSTDKWFGQNQILDVVRLSINPKAISTKNKQIDLKSIDLQQVNFKNETYARLKPPTTKIDTGKITDSWQLFGWKILIDAITMRNCSIASDIVTTRAPYQFFDGQHVFFKKINADLKKINWVSDTVTFKLNISAIERSGLQIDELKSNIVAYPNVINFNNLLLKTNNSTIKNKLSFSFADFNKDISSFVTNMNINADLKDTKIAVSDLAFFSPDVKQFVPYDIQLTGKVKGTVASFAANDLNLATGNTQLNGDLIMRGLPNANKTYIDFTNGNLSTNYNDISKFAPSLTKIKTVNLNALGNIKFIGNYSGYFNDFVTYGKITTNLGIVDADLNLKLPTDGVTQPSYNGKILTSSFNLGKLLNNNTIGNIGFNGKINGQSFDINKINADINGTTTVFEYNGYKYQNITTNGNLNQKKYVGSIDVNDPNLVANLSGTIDIANAKPILDIKGSIKKSDFQKLKFINQDLSYVGDFDINATGANINDFNGTINLTNAVFKNKAEILPFSFLNISSKQTALGNDIQFISNEFEGDINGKFTFNNLGSAFTLFLHQYYPDVFSKPKTYDPNQIFNFNLTTRNIDQYLKIFTSDVIGFNNAVINGNINTSANTASFNGTIPFMAFGKYKLSDLVINGSGNSDSLSSVIKVAKAEITDSVAFENSEVNINTVNNATNFKINSVTNTKLNNLNLNGKLTVLNDGVTINFEPSDFTVNNKKWELDRNGELILRKNLVYTNDIKFKHFDEEISLSSIPPEVGETMNKLKVDVKNIEINDFMPFILKTNSFYGKLNGTIEVDDPTNDLKLKLTNAYIADFVKDNELIGKIELEGDFDLKNTAVNYKVANKTNPKYLFNVDGSYKHNDTLAPPIANKITLNGTDLSAIKEYLTVVFENVTGKAYGELEIFGDLKKQYIIGTATVDTFAATVKFSNVRYKSYKPIINFNINEIDFTGMKLLDTANRSARVVSGKISHSGFLGDMGLNIDLASDNIELLNTTRFNNTTFYGTAVGDAKFSIKGKIAEKLKMNIAVLNPSAANIVFNTSATSKTLGKASFIEFKEYGTEMTASKPISNSSLDLNMRFLANDKANVTVVIDEETNDQISAKGTGDIQIIMAENEIKMTGLYTVEQGVYSFRQALIAKNFDIKKGSTIKWTGDPVNADINISATYKAFSVALGDLDNSSSSLSNSAATSDLLVVANLKEKLTKPEITFEIKLPENATSDPVIINKLAILAQDKSNLAKQVAFLVLFNRLLNENNIQSVVSNTAINTISGVISAEASNVINSLIRSTFGDKIKTSVDFRTYSAAGASPTSYLNRGLGSIYFGYDLISNKVTIYYSGNFDFNLANQSASSGSLQFLSNFVLEYKILANGSIVGTFFYRENLDQLSAGSSANPSRRANAGAGIAWRKESDNFWDLFRRKKKNR